MANVSKMLIDALAPLCRQYGLRSLELRDECVLFASHKYALHFYTEPREQGIFLEYIDIPQSPPQRMRGYALGYFLFVTRPTPAPHTRESAALLSQEESIRVSIQQYSKILMEKGQDILRGEKEWLKDYPSTWGIDCVPPYIADAISRILEDEA